MNILVIKFRHIGDVLLSTALIDNLKLVYPTASIDIAVNDDCIAMVENDEDIERVLPYPRREISRASAFDRVRLEYRYLKTILSGKYDIVINLTEGDRGAIYSFLSRAPRRLGYESRNPILRAISTYTDIVQRKAGVHTVERDLSFLETLGKNIVRKCVVMRHSREDEKKIASILSEKSIDDFVLVHPVSRWLFKCWRDESFAEVIDILYEKYGRRVVVTAAPDPKEMSRVANIVSKCESPVVDLSGKLSLGELSALISEAELFIGVDTAPMHMASAHDIPVIALFGPSNPVSWGPWENELQKGCYEKVYRTQRCGKHTVIQHGDDEIVVTDEGKISKAMMKIEVSEVVGELERFYGDGV